MEPEALQLKPKDFLRAKDYVSSYVRATRKMHNSDVRNEFRRRESLGYSFKTENLQPTAFRKSLVKKSGRPHRGAVYHLTAMVPILRENYRAKFNGTKKPIYTKIDSEFVRESHVLGVLTAEMQGYVPPVTLCEQYNDLRADEDANFVYTYAFVGLDP